MNPHHNKGTVPDCGEGFRHLPRSASLQDHALN